MADGKAATGRPTAGRFVSYFSPCRAERKLDLIVTVGEARWKRITGVLFYRVFNKFADPHIPEDAGDFRLLDRRVVDVLLTLPERTRFMKGLFTWVGFRQIGIPYDRPERGAGGSKWSFFRLWNFAIEGVTGFSSLPLKVWSYLGVLVAGLAFLYAALSFVWILIHGRDVPGYASIITAVLLLAACS